MKYKKYFLILSILVSFPNYFFAWIGGTHILLTKKAFKYARELKIISTPYKLIDKICRWNAQTDFRNELYMTYYKKISNKYILKKSKAFVFYTGRRQRKFYHFASLQHFYDPGKKTGFVMKDIKTAFIKNGIAHLSRRKGAIFPLSPLIVPSNQYEATIHFPSGKKNVLINSTFRSGLKMMQLDYKKITINNLKRWKAAKYLGGIIHLFQDVTVPYHTNNSLGSLQLKNMKWITHARYIMDGYSYMATKSVNKKLTIHYYRQYLKLYKKLNKNLNNFFHEIAWETSAERASFKTNLNRCCGMTMVLIYHFRSRL